MMHYERVTDAMGPIVASARDAMNAVGRVLSVNEFTAWVAGWWRKVKGTEHEPRGWEANMVVTAYVHAVFARCYIPGAPYYVYLERVRAPRGDDLNTIDYLGNLLHELKLLPLESISALLTFQAKSSWHLLAYADHKKTYQVSDGLALQLRDTELRGLVPTDIALPYEAIYLEIPKVTGFQIWNTDSGWHPVEGVYIVADEEQDEVLAGILPTVRSWRFMFIGGEEGRQRFDDAIVYFTVMFPEGATLDEVIKTTTKGFIASVGQEGTNFAPMIDCWEALFRWAFNVVVYATWPNAEVAHVMLNREARQLWERLHKLPPRNPRRKKLSQQLADLDPRRRIVLGSSVVYIDRSRAEAALSGAHGTHGVTVATRVQGHWKNQAHGEGWTLRKRIWVQPYWRGLEDGLPIRDAVHRLT